MEKYKLKTFRKNSGLLSNECVCDCINSTPCNAAANAVLKEDEGEDMSADNSRISITNVKRKALICFFSYTGNTRQVAHRLDQQLGQTYETDFMELEPTRKRRYLTWLAYSFIPESRVKIIKMPSDVTSYDLVCLGTPKWTFSCPVFNEFLHKLSGCGGKRVALFVTFGGFREEPFIHRIIKKLEIKGAGPVAVLAIKRRNVTNQTYVGLVDEFVTCLSRETGI